MPVHQTAQQENQIQVAVDIAKWLLDTAVAVGDDLGESLVVPLIDSIHQANLSTTLTFTIPILNLPDGKDKAASLDPVMVLDNIANAVRQAEQDLNQQNMAVSAGTVETFLRLHQGNGEIALSKISLSITPKSYV